MSWAELMLDTCMEQRMHAVSSGEEDADDCQVEAESIDAEAEEEEEEEEEDEEEEDEEEEEEEEEVMVEAQSEEGGSPREVESSDCPVEDDASSLVVGSSPFSPLSALSPLSPLSTIAPAPTPSHLAHSAPFRSIADDVRTRRRCEVHGDHCPTHSPPHLQPITTKVLHLSTRHQPGGHRSPTLPPSKPSSPVPSLLSRGSPLCFSFSPDLLLFRSAAVHQRILTGLTSPASGGSSGGSKSFLFSPLSSPSSADKENRFSSSPHRSSQPSFQLSPASAFSPVRSPSNPSPFKRRKTATASLGGTFHAMEADGGRGKDRTPRRLPR